MHWDSPWLFFTDAVLRAPTIGSILMSLGASLVGVIVFLRKRSLLGESLSHASYPGVLVGVFIAGLLGLTDQNEWLISVLILFGATLTAFLGLITIQFLENKVHLKSDSALCFVLSSFFGIGLTLASHIQFSYSLLYRQVQSYLYGQAATMTDVHIYIYGLLSLIIIGVIFVFQKELQVISFDRAYAKSLGVAVERIELITFILIVLAVVIGIRSVGVVLMSAMLIAPPAAARQYTHHVSSLFFYAGFFGILSGFFGNYFSVELTQYLMQRFPEQRLSLPTGPMIVLIASLICFFSLFFAPKRGLILRLIRIIRFRFRCRQENILKTAWRHGKDRTITLQEIAQYQNTSLFTTKLAVWRLVRQGWLSVDRWNCYRLTSVGKLKAEKIIRLHRLWEVYLADYLGVGAERVHRNAEEMEHIITPELERELTYLLQDPQKDPHNQPIPPKEL